MKLRHYGPPPKDRNDWKTIRSLIPYLLEFKGRVALAQDRRLLGVLVVPVGTVDPQF